MRQRFLALCIALFCAASHMPTWAQVHISIGINVPTYPQLVAVPGYPVYYAPALNANYFFYDGRYWVFEGDNWYVSSWYNGPWQLVAPIGVPYFLLRVPVRYYRVPPPYFRGWERTAPPHWDQHYGAQWQAQHRDWNRWDHHSVPQAAPLPAYQRQYSGQRYPHPEQQREIESRNYRYQPREHGHEDKGGQDDGGRGKGH